MTSWGTLLQNAQQSLQSAPHMAIIPGLFVMLTIYSFNNIGNLVTQYVQGKVSSMANIVELKNLKVDYTPKQGNKQEIIHGIDIDIKKGHITGVVGRIW